VARRQGCELCSLRLVFPSEADVPVAEAASEVAVDLLVAGRLVLFDLVEHVLATLVEVCQLGLQAGDHRVRHGLRVVIRGVAERGFSPWAEDVLGEELVGEAEQVVLADPEGLGGPSRGTVEAQRAGTGRLRPAPVALPLRSRAGKPLGVDVEGTPLTLYNTLGRRLERFEPLHAPRVGVYSCGPTVYAYPHVGNLRAYVFADTLKRVLRWKGYDVTHVINITDVGHLTSDEDLGDDKVEQAAQRTGRTVWDVAAHYTQAFLDDIHNLGIELPDEMPRATDHVAEMIKFAERLVDRGYAYELPSGLYFDTSKFARYGELAGLDIEGLREGARVYPVEGKRHKTDFALWRTAEPDSKRAMEWDSPWGRGAPGWHLECSVMSIKYLGDHFDLHTGGIDHVPVHHVNEIAQSEAWLGDGRNWVPYWLHNEFLNFNSAKMSKSAGKIVRLVDLEDEGIEPAAYRLFLLGAHYRAQLEFDLDDVRGTQRALTRLRERVSQGDVPEPGGPRLTYSAVEKQLSSDTAHAYLHGLDEALASNLNTAAALAQLNALVRDTELKGDERRVLIAAFEQVLGLGLTESQRQGWFSSEEDEEISALVRERDEARRQKDWARADAIRDRLLGQGVVLEDRADGTSWRRA
jgi:cysteinyl-tRNA synthetase